MKLIALLIGVAVGFGGGVYWGVHHPTEANSLSATEEKQFLQLQLKTSQAIKSKLDSMSSNSASNSGGVKGFVSGLTSGATNNAEVESLRTQQNQQINDLQARLDKLN